MPLTKSGREVLSKMAEEYGEKKGKEVFYASMNKGKPGSSKWHKERQKKHMKKAKSRGKSVGKYAGMLG